MDVGVTVGALGADVSEYRLGVALLTGDAFVQSAQRKFCAVVVELGDCADGFPAGNRMAVLTGDIQIPVRAAGCGIGLRLPILRSAHRQQYERGNHIQQQHGPQSAPAFRGFPFSQNSRMTKLKMTNQERRSANTAELLMQFEAQPE